MRTAKAFAACAGASTPQRLARRSAQLTSLSALDAPEGEPRGGVVSGKDSRRCPRRHHGHWRATEFSSEAEIWSQPD